LAFDFPNSPTVGQIATGPGGQSYQFDGSKWVILGGTTPGWIVISDTVPANPAVGQFWLDSIGMQLYVYYQDPTSAQWIPVSNQPISSITNGFNKFINPFLEIDQAHEGVATTCTGSGVYLIDGFIGASQSSSGVYSGIRAAAGPPGAPYHLTTTTTTAATSVAAGDYHMTIAPIEADDICDTAFGTASAQPLTLSFLAWCTIAGTYYAVIRNGVTNNRSYVAPFTITTASTWQLLTITIPGDTGGSWTTSGNTNAMNVTWTMGAGTTFQTATPNSWLAGNFLGATGMSNAVMTTLNAAFALGPCKLEVGSTATPMRRQSFQAELARAQRYYEKSYTIGTAVGAGTSSDAFWTDWYSPAYAASSIQMGQSFYYKVPKRAIPTLSLYSPVTGASGKLRDAGANADVNGTIWVNGTNSFGWYGTLAAASNNGLLYGHMVADARL